MPKHVRGSREIIREFDVLITKVYTPIKHCVLNHLKGSEGPQVAFDTEIRYTRSDGASRDRDNCYIPDTSVLKQL